MPDPMLYKIMPAALWASAADAMPWAPVDVADGFVHLSSASQVRETARRHFAGQRDLVLLEVDPSALPEGALRWEVSRGGALFPHVYGDVPVAAIVRVTPLTADEHGFAFPGEIP